MKALTSRGRGYQPQPLDRVTERARQQGEQRNGSWEQADYHFPGPLRPRGFLGKVAFRVCVCSRHSEELDHKLFKDKERD